MKHGWILMILACTGANAVEQRDYPARPVREFIELAKAKPEEIRMGSAGIGATSHLGGILFTTLAGIKGE